MPNINGVNYPVGSIDFSKPLVTDDGDAVTVVTVLPVGEYPVIVQIAGEEQIEQINAEGNSLSGSVEVQNAEEGPKVVYAVLLNEGAEHYFSETAYLSEADARASNNSEDIVAVTPVTIPVTTAEVASDLASVNLNGRAIKVGDTIYAYRRHYGDRQAKVVKVRNDVRKSLYIDPQDGNAPYWALNKNIR